MNKIFIKVPSPQEAELWAATNATALMIHIASIKHIIKIANLLETGVTPNRDTKENLTGKAARSRSMFAMVGKNQMRSAHIKNLGRVTMMPVVLADGRCGRTLFVVQRRTLPFRIVEVNGVRATQSLANCLPKYRSITTREDVAGVHKFSFEG